MKSNKTVIFIHGGAIKGAFGAGFMYGLSQIGVTTADLVVGASSGAATASYFVSKQFEEIRDIWTNDIAKKELVKYSDVFIGKPAFNLDYLIGKVFRNKHPLEVGRLLSSEAELRIPLCHYPDHSIEFFSSREQTFQKNFWDILHTAITMHDRHILWGTPWEEYVDADLDPFALYRKELVPKDWNVLVISNHYEMGNTLRKWLGLKIFLLIQTRHFPRGAKEMLRSRVGLISTGMECLKEFQRKYEPIIVMPKKKNDFGPISVIQRNNEKLNELFKAGEKMALDMKPQLGAYIQRSSELLQPLAIPISDLGAPSGVAK